MEGNNLLLTSSLMGEWAVMENGQNMKSIAIIYGHWKTPKVFANLVGTNFDGFVSLQLSFGIYRNLRFGTYLVSIWIYVLWRHRLCRIEQPFKVKAFSLRDILNLREKKRESIEKMVMGHSWMRKHILSHPTLVIGSFISLNLGPTGNRDPTPPIN